MLKDHLEEVSRLAAAKAAPVGLVQTARLAGLLHDLGKYDPAFDQVLRGLNVRVDHSTAGGAILHARASGAETVAAQVIGYCILGHHAGLPDRTNASSSCMDRRIGRFDTTLDPVWETEIDVDFDHIPAELAGKMRSGPHKAFDLSVATRMVFSCLVDADFRDTERFYTKGEGRLVDRDWPRLRDLLPNLLKAFDRKVSALDNSRDLNLRRAQILRHVRAQASRAPGLFTLTVPTGGGKTLASMGFALDHAGAHGASRIIYAIPYTSIIDQTAQVFREIFGADAILEHHSAIEETEPRALTGKSKLQLAMEDWAAPIVVTTNIQLFESLFSARPSRARKLHNIAGSIIVLDEAQCLPRGLLRPTLRMLETLTFHYGCTVVLCTATQPAFDSRQMKDGLDLKDRELAPDPPALARRFRRARIVLGGEMDDLALLSDLAQVGQGLVIVNSRAHALALYRRAKDEGLEGVIHLTTRQYPAHRQDVLAEIRRRLASEPPEPCRVIATSLVEAGVDLSFPRVWRAEAGLDSVVQAAGRCNREDRWALEDSVVTMFFAPDYPMPRSVVPLAAATRMIAEEHGDLLSTEAISDWFEDVYWRLGADRLDAKGLLKSEKLSFSPTNPKLGASFAFREISDLYRMIDSPLVPVIIRRAKAAGDEVNRLHVPDVSSGAIARKLQRYIVQVPEPCRERLRACGHGDFAAPELRGEQFFVLTDETLYHDDFGLLWEDAEYLSAENVVI
ncbi:CRISPR-associated helicase Cas3' [Tropicimonas sediminicola]|uniref:CRISPR-associated helicase Cas3' n=1 Tax=Tropicimonas sediminicola TaxID=1031541 RepID=UPI001FE352CE|nr:CRISPR-associated helicase Cas3' [Tropicimonas sediminicola]